ncbi:hypothetical protein FJT64_006970 [Amphibalanus amphitrite]|uniref:Ig-like domain-containing protein n=1 Tax=Amphibalanus amphitrite TaxID=1232801 RepID=A0A6A4VVV4_AMPAM|nr:hypothetical protein FJT64_006970 [Amphibalanus amphitrite]
MFSHLHGADHDPALTGRLSAPTGHVTEVVGVMGRPADLPCDTSSSDPADQATLVLWYKDGESIPMYSFDGRGGRPLADRTVGAPPPRDVLFVTHTERPALRLAAVTAHDEGHYRCRVDFRNSQTRNYRINLTVIVPPERPIILYNTRTVTGRIGPLQEDEPLELVCLSQGGKSLFTYFFECICCWRYADG